MNERNRNKLLLGLMNKLISDGDKETIEMLGTLIENDTESMKKGYELMLHSMHHHSTREEQLENIVKIMAKNMFYGDWEWETPNERTQEMLMRQVGYWPFKDEDDMIASTPVPEELYVMARKTVPTRVVSEMSTEKRQTTHEAPPRLAERPSRFCGCGRDKDPEEDYCSYCSNKN